jgi:hypothetical protein
VSAAVGANDGRSVTPKVFHPIGRDLLIVRGIILLRDASARPDDVATKVDGIVVLGGMPLADTQPCNSMLSKRTDAGRLVHGRSPARTRNEFGTFEVSKS